MTLAATPSTAAPAAWACPFCPLMCDGFQPLLTKHGGALELPGAHCPRATAALARFNGQPTSATPRIGGQGVTLEAAVAQAAAVLAASRQPLFGGLGTDVAGARALYALACATGAISDAAHGAALHMGLRATQDRGAFTTSLAEVRNRADVIVCVGGLPGAGYPRWAERCGVGEALVPQRRIIVLAPPAGADIPATVNGVPVLAVPLDGDLFDAVALLAALLDDRPLPAPAPDALAGIAQALKAAAYGVFVWTSSALPAHGGLVIETINRCVAALNRSTRAAALPLGGGDGAGTVNAVFTWLSGLPLRTRAGPLGLEHEPLGFDASHLLAKGSVDALLWVASYGTEPPPPATSLPLIFLGHPAFGGQGLPPQAVFIPVSTPGVSGAGHAFRADGSVLLPLAPLFDDGLPSVADVLKRIGLALCEGAPA